MPRPDKSVTGCGLVQKVEFRRCQFIRLKSRSLNSKNDRAMSVQQSFSESSSKPKTKRANQGGWHWLPSVPLVGSPLGTWPVKPLRFLKTIVSSWLPLSDKLLVVGVSILTWLYLTPDLERCQVFVIDWMAQVYLRNLGMFAIVAGGLHLYLYTFKAQGDRLRYDSRKFQRNNPRYTFNNQIYDNMFWSLASGVTVWSAYEIVGLWAYANGIMPYLAWADNPLWFIALFVLTQLFGVFHFYWIHRLIHWPPLYRTVHALHHRNVNVGPWSGMSMHPVEHVLYLSSALIHLFVASHPIHFIFNLQQKAFLAASSHTGFESITFGAKKDSGLKIGDFFHQLHHRYFECNYGEPEIPCDEWFGSFHDGTPEATKRMNERLRKRRSRTVAQIQ